LAEGEIEAQIAPNIRTWRHTGFNVDEGFFIIAAGSRHFNGFPQVNSVLFAGRQGECHDVLSGSTTPYIVLCLPGIIFFMVAYRLQY
jgi:hypothetical protein